MMERMEERFFKKNGREGGWVWKEGWKKMFA
jgi:hypothetical protein